MRKPLGFLLVAVLAVLAGTSCIRYVPYNGPATEPPSQPYEEPAYGGNYGDYDSAYFYNELEPYGTWLSLRPYGYVWLPGGLGYNWRPYTMGHWAWTDYGWTWVSMERWGWICFHYGRWGWHQRLGWYWVPDVVWGPAWVAWRWDDIHIGWAPLPPGADFFPGRGFGRRQWDIPGHYWNFVRGRDFLDRRIDRWVLPAERNVTIINLTRFSVNINERDRRIVNEGVDVDLVRRQTSRPIDRYTLKDATRPGPAREEGRDLVVSRPAIRRNEAARPKRSVDEAEAEKEVRDETGGRIIRRPVQVQGETLRQEHEKEMRLLRESQENEIAEIRRKTDQEKARLRNPADKRKVDEQTAQRLAELKKKHAQEKADLEKRQKAEDDKTKRPPVRRKIEAERR